MNDNLALGAESSPPQRSFARFNEWLIHRYIKWLAVLGRSRHTQRMYGLILNDFARFLGAQCVLGVSHADLLAYLTVLYDRGRAPATIFLYIEALKSFGSFISLLELPNSGALGRLITRKVPKRIGDSHTLEEIEKLLAAAGTPLERALLELAFATACRVSELARICVEDIDWAERRIRVFGKGSKERVVYFGQSAETALRALLCGRTAGFVFRPFDSRLHKGNVKRTIPDEPLSVRHIETIISAIGARAGIKTHPHQWRHACASAMLADGAGLREIQTLLGHEHLSTTARYLHSTFRDLCEVHRNFHPHEDRTETKEGEQNGKNQKGPASWRDLRNHR